MKVALKDLSQFCAQWVPHLKAPHLVLLNGPLGAGKTQFVKLCVNALMGQDTAVDSPTFSVINEYSGAVRVYHVDLYRLEGRADVESTGFWDLFEAEDAIIFVEWPERLNAADLPVYWRRTTVNIQFTENPEVRDFEII